MPNIVTVEFIAEVCLQNQRTLEEIIRRLKKLEEMVEETSVLTSDVDSLFDEHLEDSDGTSVEKIETEPPAKYQY